MIGRARTGGEGGFTLIELLVVMMIIGTLLSIAVPRYFRTLAHARETVLRQDLAILREAIDKYYADLGQYPDTLAALADKRYVRRLYFDPMTNSADWQLVLAPEGGIKGVYSGSMRTPIKRANFAPVDAFFADSDCYCAWQFVYEPRLRRWGAPGNPAPGNPAPGGPARGGPAPGGPAPGGPAPGIPIPGYLNPQ